MTIFNVGVRVAIFGLALLMGTTVVAASRFVFNTIADVLKPAAVGKSATFTVEPEPFSVLEEKDFPSEEISQSDLDPDGPYSLDIEKVPKAFNDIQYLYVTTRDYADENGNYTNRPVVPFGSIQTNKHDFSFEKIAIGNREISFETESVDGISYQFVGQFPNSSEAVYCETCEYPPDLTGTLTKRKNGKVLAEMNAKFYISGC
jgi:hypothetical protein